MSVDTPTRQQPTPPPPPSRSGFNPVTLFIAAIASVIAAVVVSKIWPGGTLWATAMTPVIVSLVKEGLERPAQKIGEVTVVPRRPPRPAGRDELIVEEVEPGPEPEPGGYKFYGARKHAWRIAVITGLLGFAVAAAALTLPELVAGRSVVNGGKKTTIFRGHRAPATQTKTTETTTTPTTTTPADEQPTTTTPPATQTTPPATTTTTTPTTTTPPPATTQPAPATTQPATPPPTP